MPADSDHGDLLDAFAARLQMTSTELTGTAEEVVKATADLVGAAQMVSLTMRIDGRHLTLAATDPIAEQSDRLQYALDEGPCLEAAENIDWVRSTSLRTDPRWPRWGSAAGDLGLGSMLAVHLLTSHDLAAAINCYSRRPHQFDDRDDVDLVVVVVSMAAVALTSASTVTSDDQTSVRAKHTIAIAQGMLMSRYDIDEATSLALLRQAAGQTGLSVRDVATHLVDLGRLPELREPPLPQ